MTSRPVRRRTVAAAKEREHATTTGMKKLFTTGPYHRNEVTREQITELQDLIDRIGFNAAAEKVGLTREPMLKVTSGFAHKLRPETSAKIRKFFDA